MTAPHALQIHATPYRQFPLRLPHEMARKLDGMAQATRIPKSTIARDAIEKRLIEMERSGIDEIMNGLFKG